METKAEYDLSGTDLSKYDFGYYDGADHLPKDVFKISPSRMSRFFDDTSNWYRECLLGEDPVFNGNTASHLGTIVHGMAEMYIKFGRVDYSAADRYLQGIIDPEVDKVFIESQYVTMTEALISNFLSGVTGTAEPFLYHEVIPGIVVGGSIDLLRPTEIVDYKTTSQLTAPDRVSRAYYFQQMCYVWLARKHGYDIQSFRLVYITTNVTGRISEKTGKPMKDYPTTVTSVVHQVTPEDMQMIDGVISLVAESVKAFQSNPKIRHLLAQDMRLKERVTFLNK